VLAEEIMRGRFELDDSHVKDVIASQDDPELDWRASNDDDLLVEAWNEKPGRNLGAKSSR
jgi:hypothetical protein